MSTAVILDAFLDELSKPRPPHKSSGAVRLWASNLGQCPRRAMLRVLGYQPPASFSPELRACMAMGIHYEDDTFRILRGRYGSRIKQDVAVGNECWSGKIDFLLMPEDDKGRPRIIEHKAKGGSTFDYNGNLPEEKHVCQALLYKYLYELANPGVEVDVSLFYRGWTHFAEFDLVESLDGVRAEGMCRGDEVSRWLWLKPTTLRLELESWFNRGELPPLPQCPSGKQGCLFRGDPSCSFYDKCWGNDNDLAK